MNQSLFINNQWIKGDGKEFNSLNPATHQPFWTGQYASVHNTEQAIEAAKVALPTWAGLSASERYTFIEKYVEELKNNKEQMAKLISVETGKPKWEALTEAGAMAGKAAISKEAFEKRTSTFEKDMPGKKSITRFKPHGVVAVFGPFNFPGHLPNGHIIPALLAGNTVVFKPSEQTPAVGEFMVRLWEKAGLPKGVLNLVHGRADVGSTLILHKDIRGVFFTGSSQTGLILQKSLSERPEVILALEMGGNNPLVIWDTKDLKAAAYQTILSAYITAGQRCTCSRRLIIQNNEQGEALLSELKEQIQKIRVDLPSASPEPFMGTVISNDAAEVILKEQKELLNNGAQSLVECKRVQDNLPLLTPGLIDVTEQKNRRDFEIFGPLLQVIRVNTFEEAIDEANNTRYGLSAGLICDDSKKFDEFYLRINAGIVNYNTQLTGAASSAPFGGIGLSGNHHPSAYFAADYCSYPVACLEAEKVEYPETKLTGLE